MDRMRDQAPTNHPQLISLGILAPNHIPFSNNLWFDTDTYAIVRKGKRVPLTAREARLLTIFLNAPNHYYSADTLSRMLSPTGAVQIAPHCVEQTMYGLRRKLGEHGRRPRLLLNRREIGYGIFLPKIIFVEQNVTQQPRQNKAGT